MMDLMDACVIGLDFGTDSLRAVIVNAGDGELLATEVCPYPRWQQGKYCAARENRFRQHPLDYLEAMQHCLPAALRKAPRGAAAKVRAIGIDTTGSTPCAVDRAGLPLAMLPEFSDNPNAMFILWKDHTAINEAEEINDLAKHWGGEDFTQYEGGVYSCEWFWAKVLHILRQDPRVAAAAFSWVEHCDWMPALLTGQTDPLRLKRSRCAAGHKAMWHASWGGLPSEAFLTRLDSLLAGLRQRLYHQTYTVDVAAGLISEEWAERLGLPRQVVVGVGAFDAHLGAVGAEIKPHTLVKVMGTSTCDMIVDEISPAGEHLVAGICGQVDGSIIPGMIGMEAGQSAVGDVFAWFKQVLLWPVEHLLQHHPELDDMVAGRIVHDTAEAMIPALAAAAEKIPLEASGELAVDWLNGRRTPDADQSLKGGIMGLNLASDAPRLFRALVEATAFGAKAIIDRFIQQGVTIEDIIAIGGIPKKSPFIMQVYANVLNMPIQVAASEYTCALGAAMAAAVAAKLHADIPSAQKAMGSGFETTYFPDPEAVSNYQKLYRQYQAFAQFIEFAQQSSSG